jgi:hypothetical protein
LKSLFYNSSFPSVLSFPQPLLLRWQMMEGAIATTVTTMMFRTHPQHLSNY